ncbi:helix-turn-helix domain-containing protein [Actinomadura roseirufa]|uniref:helix-turn-helix domain-containing protein n=1 Tax=Actinomadura roseirufa TaxID=2094049 RepID=UPI0010412C2B|nr:helix-turn-helix transcriptional regulator [Actinomadura roseirufa]
MHPPEFWRTTLVRTLIAEGDFGGLVRAVRERAGWRQADLAHLVGYSIATISRLENRRGPSGDVAKLRAISEAAGIPATVFAAVLHIPHPALDTVGTSPPSLGEEEDPMRRRAVLAAGLTVPFGVLARVDDALAYLPDPARPASLTQVTRRLATARARFDAGDLTALLEGLPDLMAAAHRATTRREDPAAEQATAAVYALAAEALNKVGRTEASRITADRAVQHAERSGDPIEQAAAARALGMVLRHQNRPELAERVTLAAAATLERTGLTTPDQRTAWAQILSTCAYNAAQARDRTGAIDMIEAARDLAGALPERPSPAARFAISGAQVGLYEVGTRWALGDPGRALEAARGLRLGMFHTAERRGRYATDLARVHRDLGNPEQTTRYLLLAAAHATSEVNGRPSIRAVAQDIVTRHRNVPGAPKLAAVLNNSSTP